MRFTVQYIPLSKIKPDVSLKITHQMKLLRNLVRDCMYLLVVRKNRKDGSFTIVSGVARYKKTVVLSMKR